jgi:hypothetical protein
VGDSPKLCLHDGTLEREELGGAGWRKPSRSLAHGSESSTAPVPSSVRWRQTSSASEARYPLRGTGRRARRMTISLSNLLGCGDVAHG